MIQTQVILHQLVKFRCNRTIGGEVLTSYPRWRSQSRKSTSGFGFGDCTHLGRWKSNGITNFDEISQSTAEIKLLSVSENGRPPFRNSISVFYFCPIFVIGVSFCIGPPNFVKIELPLAELWHHINFFKMAAGSHIGFELDNIWPPTKCNCRCEVGPQIWSGSDL